ncbi:SDR family NAD(P)-dependent oxidoreductase [Micromonospora krabiensis]|uniref:NAD(P)-dependent dehydrogenase, short-chain alcohol dehydrogenase family n=1 Tax=Micromonospora krabiensis TaxID=307121 RepID=A0A1C3MYG6_9ACTN|nr:SDR family NAD(P)-dependent oxidoreductase [Micromonospora krabiensis]SBV25361.1 NAD(P)-dependent dehydrogenase, short-chain alcohol dehydrogenase family [Micromonospora krabiensis]
MSTDGQNTGPHRPEHADEGPRRTGPRRGRRAVLGLSAAAAGAAAVFGATTVPAYLAATPTNPPPPAPPEGRFAGKVVLITGGTSGIGAAAAHAFAAEGARVSFCGRRAHLGEQVRRQIDEAGGTARYVPADVRNPEQLQRFVDGTVEAYGRLDVAVNNAGITRTAAVHELALQDWTDVLDTNARGVFLAIKYEVPHMLRAGHGIIVCTTSESRRPGGAAYTASKQALKGIVEAAAMDYGHRGIRVNAIAPGTTDTPFVRPDGLPDVVWEAFKRAWGPLNVSALQRMATPQEIARAVVALSTDDFSYLAGSTVLVGGSPYGGGPMRMPPGFPERQ